MNMLDNLLAEVPPKLTHTIDLPGDAAKDDEPKLRAAVAATERGFHVFRIQLGFHNDGSPRKNGFKGWQAEATNDPETAAALWRCPWGRIEPSEITHKARLKSEAYNIGIRTGMPLPNGGYLLVLDVDVKKGKRGDETLRRHEAEHGPLPDTFAVRSTTGGLHFYLRVPEPMSHGAGDVLGSGLDVRCANGLVMAPGSIFGDKAYQITRDAPIAACPDWITDKLREAYKPSESVVIAIPGLEANGSGDLKRAERYLRDAAPFAIEHGVGNSRNQTAFELATTLKDWNLSEETAAMFLDEHWNTGERDGAALCTPPLDWNELQRTVASAYNPNRASYRPRGFDCPDHQFAGTNIALIGHGGARVEIDTATTEQQASLPLALFDGSRLIGEVDRDRHLDLLHGDVREKIEQAKREEAERRPKIPLDLNTWINLDIPKVDYLMGAWAHTQSRALIVGDTGAGKTNLGLALAIHMAVGKDFLNWRARRPVRVLYLDGEMGQRLMQCRAQDAARRLGMVVPRGQLSIFSSATAEDDSPFQPLNTKAGQHYVDGLLEHVGAEYVFFDNIMALTAGEMSEEGPWREVQPWILGLTRRNIGQTWMHHTGHDSSRSFGTKTREWQMDVVAHLTKVERAGTDVCFDLEFRKARERTPENRAQFANTNVSLENDQWLWRPAEQERQQDERTLATLAALLDVLKAHDGDGPMTVEKADSILRSAPGESVSPGTWRGRINRAMKDGPQEFAGYVIRLDKTAGKGSNIKTALTIEELDEPELTDKGPFSAE